MLEQALARSVGNLVEESYSRGDLFERRRTLMEAWAQHCQPVAEFERGFAPQGHPQGTRDMSDDKSETVVHTQLLITPFGDTGGLEELSPYEARAKAFVDEIIGTLDRTIASGKLTDEGVVSASTEIFRFTSYFAPLIRNLRFLDPQRAELSANYLWQLMGAAHRVGQLQGRVDQAMVATDGKRKKADAGEESIWAAIVEAAEDLGCPKLSISKEFANRLRPRCPQTARPAK